LKGQVTPGGKVFGDPQLLQQLFANIIENALNHTPRGSGVLLKTWHNGLSTCVEVVDNGPGIPAGMKEKVFKRFVRVDKSRSTPGTGLGLSLVAAIVDLHRANIEIMDAFPGQVRPGLRVHVKFPPPPAQAEPAVVEMHASEFQQLSHLTPSPKGAAQVKNAIDGKYRS
jgi:signal transduction histidine kinase